MDFVDEAAFAGLAERGGGLEDPGEDREHLEAERVVGWVVVGDAGLGGGAGGHNGGGREFHAVVVGVVVLDGAVRHILGKCDTGVEKG